MHQANLNLITRVAQALDVAESDSSAMYSANGKLFGIGS